MSRWLPVVITVTAFSALFAASGHAAGEDILAHTGQYVFFIKPDPGSCVTYHQKMVPCILKETIPVPRRTVQVFPVPVPSTRKEPVMVTETPVGCPEGSGECLQCFAVPRKRVERRDVIVPRLVPVAVPGTEMVPKEITRKVLRPQWFAVEEHPLPPKPVRKVGTGG